MSIKEKLRYLSLSIKQSAWRFILSNSNLVRRVTTFSKNKFSRFSLWRGWMRKGFNAFLVRSLDKTFLPVVSVTSTELVGWEQLIFLAKSWMICKISTWKITKLHHNPLFDKVLVTFINSILASSVTTSSIGSASSKTARLSWVTCHH